MKCTALVDIYDRETGKMLNAGDDFEIVSAESLRVKGEGVDTLYWVEKDGNTVGTITHAILRDVCISLNGKAI